MEQVEVQFGRAYNVEDWELIWSAVLAQVAPKT